MEVSYRQGCGTLENVLESTGADPTSAALHNFLYPPLCKPSVLKRDIEVYGHPGEAQACEPLVQHVQSYLLCKTRLASIARLRKAGK